MKEKLNDEYVESISKAIKHKTNLMFMLATCCDMLCYNIEENLRGINPDLRLKRDSKLRMKQYAQKIKDCKVHYESFIEPYIISAGAEDHFRDYESSRMFSNELIRLIMLYYEQCLANRDNHMKVFDLLDSLTGGIGAFTEKDINRFDLGGEKE